MPEVGDCQGLVAILSIDLNIYKTICYETKRSKCFNFLAKKFALTLKKKSTTSSGIK